MRKAWNRGLTKHTHPGLARVAAAKAAWWATDAREETRKKIGRTSKGRPGKTGESHHWWKGGRWTIKRDGYVYVQVPNHPFEKKNGKGHSNYILEHRYVMEQNLGRYLEPSEDVHHVNGMKHDNRIENLRLVSHDRHYDEVVCPCCQFKFRMQ